MMGEEQPQPAFTGCESTAPAKFLTSSRQGKCFRHLAQRSTLQQSVLTPEASFMLHRIEVTAIVVALLIAGIAVHAWLASHDDQVRLQATLAAQKQLLDAADARERERDTSLNNALSQIEALKRNTQTPEQILRDLPKYLPLPQPISFAPGNNSVPSKQGTIASPEDASLAGLHASRATEQGTATCPDVGTASVCQELSPQTSKSNTATADKPSASDLPSSPTAQIPAVDLKPLFDFVQDCRACQAQLATAKLDAADNATKIAALTRERDAAITAAKGGSFWRRLRRNILWFAVGAGAGAVAVCGTGHCRP
jgi:type II secretory pathway pseudopilin PulG